MRTHRIRKIYITLLFICLIVLLPMFLGQPQQMLGRTLVLAFGVDKLGEEYEVSVQVLVPESSQGGFKEKREVLSSKGASVDEAMASIQLKQGKVLALAHANILVISEEAIGDDINVVLDYFIRDRNTSYLTVATTPEKAKELLEVSAQESGDKNSLLRLISFNNGVILGTDSTLNKILSGYYSPSKTSIISRLTLEGGESGGSQSETGGSSSKAQSSGESAGQGGESSQSGEQSSQGNAGQEGGQSSGQEGSEQGGDSSAMADMTGGKSSKNSQSQGGEQGLKKIGNDGSVVVLKSGKVVKTFSPIEYRGFHWLMSIEKTPFVRLEHISDKNFNDATVIIDITHSSDKLKYELTDDNTPIIKFKTKLVYKVSSVEQDKYQANEYSEFDNENTEPMKRAIKMLVDSEVQNALNLTKEYQIDVWNVYDKFHQKYGNRFTNLVEANEGDYLKDLQVYVEVESEEEKI